MGSRRLLYAIGLTNERGHSELLYGGCRACEHNGDRGSSFDRAGAALQRVRRTPAFMLDTYLLDTEDPIQEKKDINGEGTHPIHCTPDRNGLRTVAGRVDERRNS
jgi:hypothetical protein